MTDLLPFGERLRRLLDYRATPATALAGAAGVPVAELDAVLAGGRPDDLLLHRLAPALGLHASDLFLLATRTVPDDLAPAELTGPWKVNRILQRLLGNRNMRIDAQMLMALGGGPYLSTSTYAMACAERIPLRDEYVSAFARAVDISMGDLTALLGIEAVEVPWSLPNPWPADLVELAWAARRLSDDQLRATLDHARVLSADLA
ncbi:MAG: hypothetical protein ABW046_11705 [Actinoplanes sp.]